MIIEIPGIPVPQARMKHSNRRGFVTTYDPRAREKKQIREFLQQFFCEEIPYPRVSFLFMMPIPKSIPKKDVTKYESGVLKHDKKPDVDNLVKLYLDCLDGICLHGDQKVSLGTCVKVYSKKPRTIIFIDPTTPMLQASEMGLSCQHVSEFGKWYFSAKDSPCD